MADKKSSKSSVSKKRELPASVKVYFAGNDNIVLDDLTRLSEQTGMSSSKLAVMAIRQGLPVVAQSLEVLMVDLEVHEDTQKKRLVGVLRLSPPPYPNCP